MYKSKTVSVRLSNAELEVIEKFQKKYEMKSQNDFFRVSASFYISAVDSMVQIATSEELNSEYHKFNKEFKDELQKVPATKTKLKEKYQLLEKMILPKFEQEIEKGVKQVEPFTHKRSAGRPPNPKAGPGRPKEEGY